jgi:hypothetical protein
MTGPMSCADARERAPELALGILGGAERAEVVLHVNGCARCQAHVAELTEVADVLPQLAPEIEPPIGFESRVLRNLGADERRTRRRWLAAVAAVAAAAIIVSITIIRVVESNDSTTVAASPPSTSIVRSVPVSVVMRGGAADLSAGWAYVSNRHGVAVALDYAAPTSGVYTVMVRAHDGDEVSLGAMHVETGRGSWTGHSEEPLGPGSRIALVDAQGNEVCHGTVPQDQ